MPERSDKELKHSNNSVALETQLPFTAAVDQSMENLVAPAYEGRFEFIVKQAPVGITIFRGRDMVVEMANEAYLQIVDRKEEEFVGRSLYDSLPEVRSLVEPLLTKVYDTGIPYHGFEFPVSLNRYGQQEITWFNFVYQALKDDNGMIFGVFVVANEVTNLVKSKRFLEESERQFRNMVMQSPIAMTIFRGPEYIIEIANHAMMDTIWRKTESEVIGRKVLEIFPELNQQKYPALLKEVYTSGVPHSEIEAYAIVGEEEFYLDFEYNPIRDTEGKVSGIMITVYDVTEKVVTRKHVEEAKERLRMSVEATEIEVRDRTRELAIKNEKLEKMNTELKSFAFVSSHDLQEPLRKIRIFAERIAEAEADRLSEKGQDYFRRIGKAASTMQTLIDDLLTYSKTSNAEQVLELVSMKKILGDVLEHFKEEIEEKKARIQADDLGMAHVIPFQFKQMLINLISNSLKFSREDVPLHIDIKYNLVKGKFIPNKNAVATQDYHHLVFSDNGIGFDNQYREKIFDIFQRLNSREKFKGTGIGLAIVKKIVSNHFGFVEAHSEQNTGTSIDIWLPALNG